jgi:transposase
MGGALEATLFTAWIYDPLRPFAQELKVAHPAMLKAITASKKNNDRVDARKIADLLRCDLLPECQVAPSWMRELRRVLRYRNLVVRQATRMKNRIAGLLMETGTAYNKQRLHGKGYFSELLESSQQTPDSVRSLLQLSRVGGIVREHPTAAAERTANQCQVTRPSEPPRPFR